MMRAIIALGLGAAVVAGGVVTAQTRTETSDSTANRETPQAETIREELNAKAQRIPEDDLAAALRATQDNRTDRARTLARPPNLDAMREELNRTAEEDSANNTNLLQRQSELSAYALPPPRPGIRPMSAEYLQSADRKEIDLVRIPVLIPADPSIRNKVKVYGMENVYTATAIIDNEANLSLTGTCNRVVGGDPDVVAFRKRLSTEPKRLTGTGATYQISRNDFGVDLSFSKFGCGYVMTIECGDPSADPRCAGDDTIVGLADSMVLANPDLAGGE